MVCTAGKTDGVAPAWEIALYALILLGTDAVLRAGGKRARGDEAASSRCPFASALQAAVFPEKVGASHHWSNGVLVQLGGSLSPDFAPWFRLWDEAAVARLGPVVHGCSWWWSMDGSRL